MKTTSLRSNATHPRRGAGRARRGHPRRLLGLALAAAVAAAAFPAGAQPPSRQIGSEPWPGPDTAPWPTGDAVEAGFDPEGLEQLAHLAETTHADSLLVIRHGRLVFERYWNDRGPDDVQQTYSGTKSAFSLLVGRVLARGDIESLDQPLVDFVPELAGQTRDLMTFRNVMAMTSGLAQWPALDREDREAGRSQLEAVVARGMSHAPHDSFIYHNAAYRVLFTALERATGLSLPDLTRRERFEPLGMK
ncbi:MAG: serine hydrolase, partial [Acidobacteria bacterium]|nr:serine hydrolase [Acidobacteriota bacterium]